MKKVGFFRSIHLKFVLIYVLLIIIAMQIIGVYFVGQLEKTLRSNFQTAIEERVDLLSVYLEEIITKDRPAGEDLPTKEEEVQRILRDYTSKDIIELRVIDGETQKVLGSNKDGYVNQKAVDALTTSALATRTPISDEYTDQSLGNRRVWVLASPVKSANEEVVGVVYVKADIENVFEQKNQINSIFASGIIIALAITALLGILLAQTITRPLSDMRRQALAMAKGNFSRKVKVYGYDEIGQLAITFNSLTKKLQEAQATTEGERRKLSSVLSYMTDGVIATDRRGRVILINEPAAKMLNVPRETVLSSPIVNLLGLEEDYTFEELLAERESVILDYSTETTPYVLRANFSVIQKETGFVNGLITVLHDITEQEKIDLERREFVANVSHELRTPLTTMRSYLEALAEGAMYDEDIAPQFLNVTRTETERMIRMVNDLLQLSKLDSKDYRMKKEWVNFVDFFNRIIDRFDFSKEQNVTFQRNLPEHAAFVEIDEDKLTQVVDNIISNALKYSPEGGQVSFDIVEQEEQLLIRISDQGVGIPKDNLDKVFERFYRVDKARTRKLGGTGLGLAIAKEVVEAHDGKIWAESTEGKGTTISFTLPFVRSDEDDWE
ncbi:cell wall metabolism sensor histidine kinase WalK [Bacillus infantis]|uniref:cell wall metabolism sensor histidine kinase WalK n=1 Tax=Bacillus infantis TaxID=324767 RepID=UPI001CD63DEE|nr:cell wall metabolism sensor histidine kinase WalK [Bacillus infantis]MCA1042230.1 cell wall metabolism sensor histidine kinase WalK [Bacillus infantis]MCR6613449.1 cell wall metabolism sensor histidine kinase WalK [Bacillus infantis]